MNAVKTGIAVAMLGAATIVAAQTANIYLDVKRQSSSKGASTRYQGYYMADKDYARTVDLAVTVKNMNQQPVTFDLEYYFIAKTANGNLKWSYDGGTQALTLAKAAGTNLTITSKELQSSKTESYYYKTETGSKYEGFIFRALVAGKVVQVNASSRQLEAAGRNEKEIESLIEAAVEGRKQVRDPTTGALLR
jgi:hypothetical protein